RRHQVELEIRLAPALVLLHDVLDDLPDQRKGPVGLLDGEVLHTTKLLGLGGTGRASSLAQVFRLTLLESSPPTLLRRGVPPLFVFSLRRQLGYIDGTTIP